MQFLGSGTGGEIELSAGTYYLRVVSTNSYTDFDTSDPPTYELSIEPVSRVDEIKITELVASNGVYVKYNEGNLYRVDGQHTNLLKVKGIAYYIDENNVRHPAANARIEGQTKDQQWFAINRPDMAYVDSFAYTDANGSFSIYFALKSPLGGLRYSAPVSTHFYDLMEVRVYPSGESFPSATKLFYYLKYTDLY